MIALRLLPAMLAALLFAALGHAATTVQPGADRWSLRHDGCELSVALADGTMTFTGGGAQFDIRPNLQLGTGFTLPSPATKTPQVLQSKAATALQVTFPVAEARELEITARGYDRLPVIFVTTKLRVLDHSRAQYYYLQTSLPCTEYLGAGPDQPVQLSLDTSVWDSMAWRPWWFIPRETGGVAILPTNVGGRAPGPSSAIFLHALPRGELLSVGDSLEASFGLAAAPDAQTAEDVYRLARERQVAELQPWLREETWNYGKPAPRWLREAEMYNLYYRPAAQWTEEVVANKLKGFPFIIGSTPDRAALERCHRHGIKLLHYVVYTCLLDTALQVKEGGQVYSEWTESIDHENRDLAKHPDWVCISQDGNIQHDAWGMEHGHKGLLNTCLHQPGLREAAVRQVRMLMEAGYDGVFIDLAGPTVECYGPKFGQHTHPHADWSNTQAYEALLRDIYRTVKQFGNDRVVMQNTCTGILQSHWATTDGQMLEAYPYGVGSTELRVPSAELRWRIFRHAEAVKRGKVIVALPYFGGVSDLEAVKQAAETSYAWTRIGGFLWADAFGLQDTKGLEDWSREFYARRAGKALGPVVGEDQLLMRDFDSEQAWLDIAPWSVAGFPQSRGGMLAWPPTP